MCVPDGFGCRMMCLQSQGLMHPAPHGSLAPMGCLIHPLTGHGFAAMRRSALENTSSPASRGLWPRCARPRSSKRPASRQQESLLLVCLSLPQLCSESTNTCQRRQANHDPSLLPMGMCLSASCCAGALKRASQIRTETPGLQSLLPEQVSGRALLSEAGTA